MEKKIVNGMKFLPEVQELNPKAKSYADLFPGKPLHIIPDELEGKTQIELIPK